MAEVVRASFELPTVAFTVLIGLAAIVWFVSLAGFGDADDAADGMLEDLLTPLGLAGVPTNVLLSLFALFGWATSVALSLTVLDATSGAVAIGIGVAIGVVAVVVAFMVIKALAPWLSRSFAPVLAHHADELIGTPAEVRSATLTGDRGYGDVRAPDGTVDRVDLRVRADRADELSFRAGDSVLIVGYEPSDHIYIVDELPALS